MPNTRSAKKQARQNITHRKRNLARKTAIKTAIKKVLTALEQGQDVKELLKQAEASLARAKSKGVLHAKTASRKISRLAKKSARSAKKSS